MRCALCWPRPISFCRAIVRRRLASLGFSPEQVAQASPGIVYVSLSAYGHVGPWAGRRGFDSLVQTSTGFNHAEGLAAGVAGPKELPMQILDHATGYLMAFGAMMARLRQSREGGSWHVRVSLAQTGRWLWGLGRLPQGLAAEGSQGRRDQAAGRRHPVGVRQAPRGSPRRDPVENAGFLGAAGRSTRQRSAGLAGARDRAVIINWSGMGTAVFESFSGEGRSGR